VPGGLGVRIDSAVYQDYYILPYYDSMIAKLIVHGKDRSDAIARGKRCLEEFIIDGVKRHFHYTLRSLITITLLRGILQRIFSINILNRR